MTERRAAVVTGASGGIGLELARLAAEAGYHTVLVARRGEVLQALADELQAEGATTTVVELDLAADGAAVWLAEQLEAARLPVEVLVNNAGVGLRGAFADMPAERIDTMLALNIVALTQLTRRLLPGMLERGRGRILNLASIAAFQPGPGMAVYYASKAYVLSLSEALWEETRGSGVTVTALCPGPTRTGFQRHAHLEGTKLFNTGMLQVQEPAAVAEEGWRGLMAGRRVVVTGATNKLLAAAGSLVPHRLKLPIIKKLQS